MPTTYTALMLRTEALVVLLKSYPYELPVDRAREILERLEAHAAADSLDAWQAEHPRAEVIRRGQLLALAASLETDLPSLYEYVGRIVARVEELREVLARRVGQDHLTEVLTAADENPGQGRLLQDLVQTADICRVLLDCIGDTADRLLDSVAPDAAPFDVIEYLHRCGADRVPDPVVAADDDL